jgi:hypothetical protein
VSVRRLPRLVLLLAALGAAACARPKVQMTTAFDLRTDGGAPLACSDYTDLGCVNFIKFQIKEEGDLTPSTECIQVDKRLDTLCDVTQLQHGTEIFRYDKDARVQIKMWGLRVFPATSCEIIPECPAKGVFEGETDYVRASDLHGQLPILITKAEDCGRKEVYRPRGTRDCYSVCDYSEPVCALQEGCVCLIQDDGGVSRDAAVPSGNGAWELVDAGVD